MAWNLHWQQQWDEGDVEDVTEEKDEPLGMAAAGPSSAASTSRERWVAFRPLR